MAARRRETHGGARPGAGRPAKARDARTVSVRIPGGEYDALQELAKLERVPFADYVRAFVRRHVTERMRELPLELVERLREARALDRLELLDRQPTVEDGGGGGDGTLVLWVERDVGDDLDRLEGAHTAVSRHFDGLDLVQVIVSLAEENAGLLGQVIEEQLAQGRRLRVSFNGIEYQGDLERVAPRNLDRVLAVMLAQMQRGHRPDLAQIEEKVESSRANGSR